MKLSHHHHHNNNNWLYNVQREIEAPYCVTKERKFMWEKLLLLSLFLFLPHSLFLFSVCFHSLIELKYSRSNAIFRGEAV